MLYYATLFYTILYYTIIYYDTSYLYYNTICNAVNMLRVHLRKGEARRPAAAAVHRPRGAHPGGRGRNELVVTVINHEHYNDNYNTNTNNNTNKSK